MVNIPSAPALTLAVMAACATPDSDPNVDCTGSAAPVEDTGDVMDELDCPFDPLQAIEEDPSMLLGELSSMEPQSSADTLQFVFDHVRPCEAVSTGYECRGIRVYVNGEPVEGECLNAFVDDYATPLAFEGNNDVNIATNVFEGAQFKLGDNPDSVDLAVSSGELTDYAWHSAVFVTKDGARVQLSPLNVAGQEGTHLRVVKVPDSEDLDTHVQ